MPTVMHQNQFPLPPEAKESETHFPQRAPRMYRAWFVFCVFFFTCLIILGAGFASVLNQERVQQPNPAQKVGDASMQEVSNGHISYQIQATQAHFFSFPQFNGDFTQPSLDAHGMIWLGDMTHQQLVSIDTQNTKLSTWTVSLDENGTMDTTVDRQGTIWFTGLTGKSLNSFDPVTGHMRSYPLQDAQGQSLAVQALAFDQTNRLWFITIRSGQLGTLDPRTGAVRLWTLPHLSDGNQLYPYCFTITAKRDIWIGMLTHGILAHFDPLTQAFTLVHVQDTQAEISAITSTPAGTIWFLELNDNIVGEIDGRTQTLKEHGLPLIMNNSTQPSILSDITITADGNIWIASPENRMILRYDVPNQHITYYQIEPSQGKPFFLLHDQAGNVWFVTHGPASNGLGRLHP